MRVGAESEQLSPRTRTIVRINEAKLQAMFNSAFDAIIVMNDEGVITEWNPQAENMFGWTHIEAIGQSLSEQIMTLKFRDAHEKAIKCAGQGPLLNRKIEIEGVKKCGLIFPIQLSITPIQMGDHYIFIAFIDDITERKQHESELISAKQTALIAVQAKSAFLAMMSHEIRTPLNGLIGITDLLLETDLNEQQLKFAEIIQESSNGLLTIVNDLLDYSKMDAGKMKLEVIELNLINLVQGQIDLMSGKTKQKNITIKTDIDSILPESVYGDPSRIGQILLNLLSNAIKFTTAGGEIVVQAKQEGEIALSGEHIRLCFSVTDNGIGMSRVTREKLFQPYTQADASTARKNGGTGLGLNICSQLVMLMNGSISVHSKLGVGSTFSFSIPLLLHSSISSSSQRRLISPKPSTQTPDSKMKGVRILVAEDNRINQLLITMQLKQLGYNCQVSNNGTEVLRALQTGSYSLILMDCQMPECDGLEATRLIRAQEALIPTCSRIPIIAITANAQPEDRDLCLQAGMDSFISKPVKKNALADILQRWLTV